MTRNFRYFSLTALFRNGDQTEDAGLADRCPVHSGEEADDANSTEDAWVAVELSDMRLEIADIKEAIGNHDLWVQDALAARNDTEYLLTKFQEHDRCMVDCVSNVRALQSNVAALAAELAQRVPPLGISEVVSSPLKLAISEDAAIETEVSRPQIVTGLSARTVKAEVCTGCKGYPSDVCYTTL